MITKELCDSIFEYKEGKLYWKIAPAARTNIGDEAGGNSPNGYRVIAYKGLRFYVHQAIFLMHNGYLPEYIDHADGNNTNNKVENLRACTQSQNVANKRMQSNNTSGYRGVWWDKTKNKWTAEVWFNRKKKFLGRFLNKDEANEVAMLAREMLHGEFARV
jgi:hypothetical protein